MLREALANEVESEESFSEDSVKPKLEDAVQRFEHYALIKSENGTPIELGRGAMGVFNLSIPGEVRSERRPETFDRIGPAGSSGIR
jgi:hypothetical protein